MEKKKHTNVAGKVALTVLLVLTVVVNIVLTHPLYTVMNMYFGKGEINIKNAENAEELDTNYYTSKYASKDELVTAGEKLASMIEAEGIVLLKNDNGALPLQSSELNVSLFGRTSVDPVYTGAGSAATESSPVDYKTAFTNAGFSINDTLFDFYANHPISSEEKTTQLNTGFMGAVDTQYTGRGFISAMGVATFVDDIIAEVPVEDYPEDMADSFVSYNGAAIVFIGRVGGEGCDLPTDMSEHGYTESDKSKHYLELDSREEAMLSYVKAQKDAGVFNKIVVVCNTANALELGFLNDSAYGIDAAIWAGCIGDQGANAVAGVLNGSINPSGRLVDTYVSDLTKDPSYANFENLWYTNVDGQIGGYESGCFNQYEEGIYVGYRYYETAAAEAMAGNYAGFDYDSQVVYPFGYGLSYTSFETAFASEPVLADGVYTFDINVTNTGDVAGKDVVELYVEAPYTAGGIEKSKVVLVGFAKTSELAAGASETVTIKVNEEYLASYDYKNNGCYVIEAGQYNFFLSENAHSWATADEAHVYTADVQAVVYGADNKRPSDKVAATNQFDYVSNVFADTKTEGQPLNMSRADFAGTFPTRPTDAELVASDEIKAQLETVFDENSDAKLGNVEGSKVYTADMPATKQTNGLSLIDLRGLAFDDEKWDLYLDQLDMSEVSNMLANAGYNTAEMLTVGKGATLDYDGPMGWSTWVSKNGGDAVCIGFPAQEMLAATWNVDLAKEMGQMIGEQGLANGFNGWYAPAMNGHRSAFAGRNYEYYSEDGFLAGQIAANEVSGAMDMGTYCYIKHFAVNDKENGRNGIATFLNEQALREIYLRPFELCIKNAASKIQYNNEDGELVTTVIPAATAVMSSYNRIGTVWAGGTYELMTQVLRNEWGFNGMSITDYFGGSAYMDADLGTRAGNDIMLNTFADGSLTDQSSATGVAVMRNAAHHVLYAVANSAAMQGVASGVVITYSLAGWQKALIAGDIAVAVIVILCIVLMIRKKNANKDVTIEISK